MTNSIALIERTIWTKLTRECTDGVALVSHDSNVALQQCHDAIPDCIGAGVEVVPSLAMIAMFRAMGVERSVVAVVLWTG